MIKLFQKVDPDLEEEFETISKFSISVRTFGHLLWNLQLIDVWVFGVLLPYSDLFRIHENETDSRNDSKLWRCWSVGLKLPILLQSNRLHAKQIEKIQFPSVNQDGTFNMRKTIFPERAVGL